MTPTPPLDTLPMPTQSHSRVAWSLALALLAGLALRLFFLLVYADFDYDAVVYATIAKNLLTHHAYALGSNPFHSTLIRLPGYPFFLAGVFAVFGPDSFYAVRAVHIVLDLASCLLLAGFMRDQLGRRAGLWTLWLAALCPFTAYYTSMPITETNSIFCICLGLFASGRLIERLRQGRPGWGYLLLTACALSAAILLRPDGGLLAAVVLPGIWFYARRFNRRAAARAALLCTLLTALPFVPWTIRNYRVLHVFQPLAPRFANDPGEVVPLGFIHWTKTWLVEFVSSGEIYWRGDGDPLDSSFLPSRAFDSPQERLETQQLIDDYNHACKPDLSQQFACSITPEFDARFEALAQARVQRHPFNRRVLMPLARLGNMWFRPRVEYMDDAIPPHWWEWSEHPAATLFALFYGLLNAALIGVAAIGFARRRVPFAAMLLAYIVLRSLLLMTIENAESRYTLECFPMLFAAAAVAFGSAAVHQQRR